MKRNSGAVLLLTVVFATVTMAVVAYATLSLTSAQANAAQQRVSQTLCDIASESVLARARHALASGEGGDVARTRSGEVDVEATIEELEPDVFRITGRAFHGQSEAETEVYIRRTVRPLFSHAVFYEDDLEILPGPPMWFDGPVHTNGDLYVGAGNRLTITSNYFKAAGKILLRRKNNGQPTGGVIYMQNGVNESGDPTYVRLDHDSSYFDWNHWVESEFGDAVADGSVGAVRAVVPSLESIRSDGAYRENAGLVIIDNLVYVDETAVIVPGLVEEHVLYDPREKTNVTVSDIDVDILNDSGYFPPNGLLYAYRTDASPSQPNGIRISNASELAGDLTVVTEDPLYIQGDFNTVDKKRAAVICDALNLLSNAYTDDGGQMQRAAPTTYNVSFATGNVPTPDGGGRYSGGLENLPRFHENWSGVVCTLSGSFNCAFESAIAKGPWGSSRVYSPPRRDWEFDLDLEDPAKLPPFTPSVEYYETLGWRRARH